MIALADWVSDTWGEVMRDRPARNVWQFAAEEMVFDAKMGNITGAYDPWLTPYTLFFQEAITSDFSSVPEEDWWLRSLVERGQRVDEAFVVKSSQSGFTQAALNACVYLPLFAPGRLLYSVDAKEKAKRMVQIRLLPFLQRLAGRVMMDDKDLSLTFIELASMILEFGGSFSAGLFSEKPLKYGFADDVEYMVSEGGVPGMLDGVHVIDHMRSRFTTADESFLGVFSKPNLESSEFITNFRGGSQHHYFVACPHCGRRQALELEGLNFSHKGCKDLAGRYDLEAVEALTTYLCAHCKKDIAESHKYEMNKGGIWLPKSREDRIRDDDPPLTPRRLSMRINDLYSPFPKVRWGILASMLIVAQNNPAKLKHVLTNHGARPWREKAINLKAEHVRAVCAGARDSKTRQHYPDDLDGDGRLKVPAYRRGDVPFLPAFLSATCDVQGDKFKWTICAWKLDGTCALIEYGACLSAAEVFEMTSDPRTHEGSPLVCLVDPNRPLIIEHGLIDSGHDTFNIYDFCIRTGWIWYPSKGVGGLTMAGRLVEGKDDFYNGVPILRYHYNDFQLKVLYYKHKIARAHDSKNTAPRLYFPEDIGDDFVVEQISESLAPKARSGSMKIMEWQHDPKVGPNDWGDAMKMQFAIWQIVGPVKQAEAQRAGRTYELRPPSPPRDLASVLAALKRGS